MQPVDKEKLKELIEEAKAANKDPSELEKILSDEQFARPSMGEVKEKDLEKMMWTQTEKGAVKEKVKGKSVIISTGPAREEDFI
jgi:hypothetical protein